MRIIIRLILVSLLMIGMNAFAQPVSAWRGHSEAALINEWGMPDIQISNANGNTTLIYNITTYRTYNRQWSPGIGVNVSSSGRPVMIVNPSTHPEMNQTDILMKCTVKFTVNRKGLIVGTSMQGEGCSASRIHPLR